MSDDRGNLGLQAVEYVYAGMPVFPCEPLGKKPLTRNGVHDATTNMSQVEEWWERWPEANIGTPTGMTVVVDIDRKPEVDGAESAAKLGLKFPKTLMQHTPSGGFHLLFAHPARGRTIHNTAGAIWVDGKRVKAPGIDLRGAGGYIVVSPSRTAAGLYVWDKRLAEEAAPAPKWFWASETVYHPTPSTTISHTDLRFELVEIYSDLENAPKGERNDTLNLCAYRLGELDKTGRLDTDAALQRLADTARGIGLSEREIAATIRSGFEAGRRDTN